MPAETITRFELTKNFLGTIGGEHAAQLVGECEKKGRLTTDEELATALGLKVTEIRTILNQLHYRGIACYQKTKNPKTGWYSYTWEIKSGRIAELLIEKHSEERGRLERKAALQTNYDIFRCKKGCSILPFEVAAEYQFRCPNCNEPLGPTDGRKELEKTQLEIQNIEKEIELIKKFRQPEKKKKGKR